MKNLLLFIYITISLSLNAQLSKDQQDQIDKIKKEISGAKHDTTIIDAWIAWDDIIWRVDPELDFELNRKIKSLSVKNLSKSLSENEKLFYSKNYAKALHNFGAVFYEKGDYAKAVNYFTRSLKLKEEIGDKKGAAASINNIGNIYLEQGNTAKAKEYYQRSLKISRELNNMNAIAGALSNMGLISSNEGDFELALDYQKQSLEIRNDIEDENGIAVCLSNIGQIYNELDDYDEALTYFDRGIELYRKLGDKQGIAMSLNDFANTHFEQKDYEKAISFSKRSLKLAKERGAVLHEKNAYRVLYQSYEGAKDYRNAFKMHKLFIELQDSLQSEENQKEIIRQEYKYSYEKKAAEDSVRMVLADKVRDASLAAERAENQKNALEAKQQEQQKYVVFAGLAIALLFGGFAFNRFRVASKQKQIIEERKQQVDKAFISLEEKNTEILDSINYAKRIQNAILPSSVLVKEHLKDSFIMYRPKDIVAGDFYWLETKENMVLFAAADCTGHGVPGAMVSVICNNGLNRSVREYGLTKPGEILDKTRAIVIEEFEKSEDDVQDGMDIALCALEGLTLEYAGANNPLWIIRDGALIEIKADKQPIGKFAAKTPYTTHHIELQKGDAIYIFSDGFPDQFGGENNRKFKIKAFKEMLLSIQYQSMEEQHHHIENVFNRWMGDYEQIDDVCIIGVQV